jgi:peptidoglycan hydrolase-like protein with peptidoglycan-binding domain
MFRSLALASALVAASLSASALSAQTSAAPSKPSASPTSPAPTVPAKADTGSTSAMNKSTQKSMKWTTEQIKEAQEGLAKAGFYKGKPTGQFNADTRKALKHYQKKNKLPVTGRLDSDVLNRLKSA